MPRPGYERFTDPTAAAHRRHEALRAYFVEARSALNVPEPPLFLALTAPEPAGAQPA
jgi:hypothetical protein